MNLIQRITELSEIVDLNEFYSINIWVCNDQISLQGHINNTTTTITKNLEVDLIYDNETSMLRGESVDGKLRITLT